MKKLLLLLLLLPLTLLLYSTPAFAAHCAYNTAGQDMAYVTGTPRNIEIFIVDKPTLGTARYQGRALTICLGTDDPGGIDVQWMNEDGIDVSSPGGGPYVNVADNAHITWTPPTTYLGGTCIDAIIGCPLVGPIYLRLTDSAAAVVTAEAGGAQFFLFVAPEVPLDGGGAPRLNYTYRPRYAIGGQIWNPVFNNALVNAVSGELEVPATINPYYPSVELLNIGIRTDLQGLYADDDTYDSNGYLPVNGPSWAIFYWWLDTGISFPNWTATWTSIDGNAGSAMDVDARIVAQGRTFSGGQDVYGYIALVLDRAVADFKDNGWWARVCAACNATQIFNVWRPVNSGTYNLLIPIPSELNGGYLPVTDVRTTGSITIGQRVLFRDYRWPGDAVASSDITFFQGHNAPAAGNNPTYQAMLILDPDPTILTSRQVLNIPKSELLTPFAFYMAAPDNSWTVRVSEKDLTKAPAKSYLLGTFTIGSAEEDTRDPIAEYVTAVGTARYDCSSSAYVSVFCAFNSVPAAFGITSDSGRFLIAIVGMVIMGIAVYTFLPRISAVMLLAFLGMVFFTLLGIMQPWILGGLLLMLAFGVLWELLLAR